MKVVIVGAVAAGATFATSLRRLDENVKIVMFEKDRDMSFGNCELPYYLSYQIKDSRLLVHRDGQRFKDSYNIDAYNYHEVIAIDPDQKYVTVLDKKENRKFREEYDYLILAPGAHANVPKSIKGTDKDHVFSIRNVVDVENIRDYYEKNDVKDILVAGGGFIAIEAAHALNELDDTKVSIFARSRVLKMVDDEMTAFIEEDIIESGVDIVRERELVQIEDKEVVFGSGKRLKADMVILALGMAANNKLAKDAGLEITEKGSIATDDNYRTSDPYIYAIGDAIDIKNFITGKKQNLKLAWPAHRQAKFLAKHILGLKAEPLAYIGTFLIKSFNLNIAMTGLNEKSLKDLGYDYDTSIISHTDKVSIMDGAHPIYMKILFERPSGKILGAQAISKGVVDKRIDVIGSLIKMGGTIYDLYDQELGYQPYYATTEDANNLLAGQAINILNGRLDHISLGELKDNKDSYEIIDIRNPKAYQSSHIKEAKQVDRKDLATYLKNVAKDKKVLLYDYNGVASSNAIKRLKNQGYDNIYMLDGGMLYFEKYNQYFKLDLIEYDQ